MAGVVRGSDGVGDDGDGDGIGSFFFYSVKWFSFHVICRRRLAHVSLQSLETYALPFL